jgi:hypothetical protein
MYKLLSIIDHMKTLTTIFFIIGICISISAQKTLNLKGTIGKYAIEMEISERDWESGELAGKYHYAGKKNYLRLEGITVNGDLVIEEYYDTTYTGVFYLSEENDKLIGKWIDAKGVKWYDVSLAIGKGDRSLLRRKSLSDYQAETTNSISGSYGSDYYFINDMWFEEDKPNLELGFNGGFAVLDLISDDSLRVNANLICGPTYHFAYMSGIAVKQPDGKFKYSNEDGCVIIVTVGEKEVELVANSSMDCGFGARAHMDHTLIKVSDEVVEPNDDWIGLNDILKR